LDRLRQGKLFRRGHEQGGSVFIQQITINVSEKEVLLCLIIQVAPTVDEKQKKHFQAIISPSTVALPAIKNTVKNVAAAVAPNAARQNILLPGRCMPVDILLRLFPKSVWFYLKTRHSFSREHEREGK